MSSPSVPVADQRQKENSRKESLSGAIARAAFGSLAFLFRLPIRLFRPVKLSSWTILESFAKRENKQLSLRYVWTLLKREKSGFIFHLLGPPILANTLIGFCLFEGYSFAESRLLRRYRPQIVDHSSPKRGDKERWTPLWIVALSGSFAGAAQCLISAPLDNVRLVLSSQQQTSRRRRGDGRSNHHHPAKISWRSIIRAAILPFAPSTRQHRQLVKAMKNSTTQVSSKDIPQGTQPRQSKSFLNIEQRKSIEKMLRQFSGGVHGAGLIMSLARDSVGFASFFFIFEVSRRIAHSTSLTTDRLIAWFNASGALPSSGGGPDADQDGTGTYKTTRIEADFSYNASRTKTGRVIAALVLIVGGGLGALCYELVGRPFELMRVVIWTGRRRWQTKMSRRTRRTAGARSLRYLKANRDAVAAQAPNIAASRVESLVTLRLANSAGSRLSRMQALLGQSHPPHPLRSLAGQSKSTIKYTSSSQSQAQTSKSGPTEKWVAPTIPRPPSALSLLIEHAEKTSTLAYTSSSRKFRTAVPNSVLLVHTYFIAPYLASLNFEGTDPQPKEEGYGSRPSSSSAPRQAPAATSITTQSAARLLSKWINKNPVSASIKIPSSFFKRHARAVSAGSHGGLTYLPPRPQEAPGSIATKTLARRWGSGRIAWALRRLASPYAVGFFAFALMSGEV